MLFTPVSLLLYQVIDPSASIGDRNQPSYLAIATFMGAFSGLLQAIGLMRWVFVVPVLANLYTAPSTSVTTREAIGVVYQAVHQ